MISRELMNLIDHLDRGGGIVDTWRQCPLGYVGQLAEPEGRVLTSLISTWVLTFIGLAFTMTIVGRLDRT